MGFEEPATDGKEPKLWGWHTIASLVVTLAIFAILASYVDVAKVWEEVGASNKGLLLLGAMSHYATYAVRGFRWRECLAHVPGRYGGRQLGLIVFFAFFLDNLLPAKLGDVYAAHLVRINCGVRRSAALGSIVFQRTVDAWMVLLLATAASWKLFSAGIPEAVVWALIAAGVLAVAATAIIVVFMVSRRSVPSFVPDAIRQRMSLFITGVLPERAQLPRIAVLTLAIWALETLWIFLLLLAFGVHVTAPEAVFLMTIPAIASVFPFTPSGAGAVELTLFGSFRLVGVIAPLAVSLTIVNRFVDFWLHIILGTVIWMMRRTIGLRTWKESATF
jgi:uncharacterized protein (TIRG00374 family)